MTTLKKYVAFDIGASNGRCLIGAFDGQTLSLDVADRFDNHFVRVLDHYYWDMVGLFDKVKLALRKAAAEGGSSLAGIGVDTWGLDFGLFDAHGDLIGNPFCYRDPQTDGMFEEAFKRVPREEIFSTTGLQFMQINTLYHLLALVLRGAPPLKIARTFLMIPDVVNYWLSGRAACEYTNASNSQLLDARTKKWAYPLIRAMGIPEHIFPEVLEPGQVLETVRRSVAAETGLPRIPVLATVTADTGAAVAAVPATEPNYAYLSSGTWGLLGAELPCPLLIDKVLDYNFGNEGGVFNTIRLLRNIPNLWLVQECRRIWALEGQDKSWDELIELARAARPFQAYVDSDAAALMLPSHMPRAIRECCAATGQPEPETEGQIIRVALESIAFKYRHTVDKLTDIVGKRPAVLHIVGGGARNKMLCQLASNACDMPVIAGPYEATTLGNLVLQMIATGDLADLRQARDLIRRSFPVETYDPQNASEWNSEYDKFLQVTGLPRIFP